MSNKREWLKKKIELKAVNEDGTFSGYASVFDNLDNAFDVVQKGAFTKTLADHAGAVPILWNHNPNEPLGFGVKAQEDTKGLLVEGQLNLEIQKGKELHSMAKMALKAGRAIGLSIGYIATEYKYDGDYVRFLEEVDLVEYSLTLFPCNEKATLTSVKSVIEKDDADEISKKKRDIEHSLKRAGCSKTESKAAVSAIFGRDAEGEAETKATRNVVKSLESLLTTLKS